MMIQEHKITTADVVHLDEDPAEMTAAKTMNADE